MRFLITEEALTYKGIAYWYKFNIDIDEKELEEIFKRLYELKKDTFLGLLYDKDKKELILYFKSSLIAWLPIVIGLSSFIGGMVVQSILIKATSGSGTWDIRSPPGYSISFWDIIKFSILALSVAFLVKVGVDAYVSFKKVEYMPSPYQIIEKPFERIVEVGKEVIKHIK